MASFEQVRKIISHLIRGPIARIKGLVYIKQIENRADEYDETIFRLTDETLDWLKHLEVVLQERVLHRRLKFEEWRVILEMLLAAELHPVTRSTLIKFREELIKEIIYNESMQYEPKEEYPDIHIDSKEDDTITG